MPVACVGLLQNSVSLVGPPMHTGRRVVTLLWTGVFVVLRPTQHRGPEDIHSLACSAAACKPHRWHPDNQKLHLWRPVAAVQCCPQNRHEGRCDGRAVLSLCVSDLVNAALPGSRHAPARQLQWDFCVLCEVRMCRSGTSSSSHADTVRM